MPLYPLVTLVIVLGLFLAISLLPVMVSENDMESLVVLPK
jgi:hypothetical protein